MDPTTYGVLDEWNPARENLDKFIDRLHEAQRNIREWQILMNIFEMKGWTDPITRDVHVVLRAQKMMAMNSIADAVEMVDEQD